MEIEVKTEGDITILYLKGKMVGDQDSETLRDEVEELIETGKINIVFDLEGVPWVDSAGLGEIIHCYTIVNRENGKLKLINMGDRLRGLLSRTRLAWVGEESADNDTR
jgi:anti-sigma B factor antagonist